MTGEQDPVTPVVSYLETTLGLSFTGPRRERLLSSIDGQRMAAGLSPEAFLAAVSRPGQAHDRLVAEVTVGETYFFRDRAQCDLLRDIVLPDLSDRSDLQRRLAMWSAGCASGEEAYTLAALAADAGLAERCVVVGSDASQRAVAKARAATYGQWSMRATSAEERARHFRQQDGRWQPSDRLRERTHFLQRNLLDGPPPPGGFDVILCRNLLIYLTCDAVGQAAQVLAAALNREGWLVTAAGDPPLNAPGLEVVRTRNGLAYRRRDAARLPGVAPTPAPPVVATTRAARPATLPASPPLRLRPEAPPPPPLEAAVVLAQTVRALGDAGHLDEACRAAAAAVQAHPLDVELRYLAGVVLLEAGRHEEAAKAAATAVYLQPQLPATHLLLGQAEHARGNADRARRSFRNASRLLAAAGDAPVALAGNVPAGHLAAIASRYLSTSAAGR